MPKTFIVLFLLCLVALPVRAEEAKSLVVITWNVERLGIRSKDRGYYGDLQLRTPDQLRKIAGLIRDELKSDIVVLQEISVSRIKDKQSRSDQLDAIAAELGESWQYFLPPVRGVPRGYLNAFCALMWNSSKVRALRTFEMKVRNYTMGGSQLFSRKPVLGWFEALKDGKGVNDFLLVGVHLKSGQGNDENHLIAAVETQYRLNEACKSAGFKESDRVILGDFNDNPYARSVQNCENPLLNYLLYKTYVPLVGPDSPPTRMSEKNDSIIDHVFANRSFVLENLPSETDKATVYQPADTSPGGLAAWRATYSDHFPVSFRVKVCDKDGDVD